MKKKLTLSILALVALTLTGCEKENVSKNDGFDIHDSIQKAEYSGHRYIIYKGYRKGGITHDPDCLCQKKGGEEQ